MIVAIEGASASGKSTWCRSHFPESTVDETRENIEAPDLYDDPAVVGRFWVDYAIRNWQRALELEHVHGLAFCDGDPFHLYYSWALWKSGALPAALFKVETGLYRAAFEKRQVGFVDYVLWLEAPAEELRRRAQADTTRRRKRHEMLLALVPWMTAWFAGRERILPGTVGVMPKDFALSDLPLDSPDHRYDIAALDGLLKLAFVTSQGREAEDNFAR